MVKKKSSTRPKKPAPKSARGTRTRKPPAKKKAKSTFVPPAPERVVEVLDALEGEHPDAKCALDFSTPLELLVATILAAQARDESVNAVTKTLFQKYRTARDWADSPPGVLEREIHSLGFFNQKARAVRAACRDVAERFGGAVPEDLDELVTLHGVGRKTANVVLGNAFGHPDRVAVDTHVHRLSQRLGWTEQKDPDRIEAEVAALIPGPRRTRSCHLLQFHGRRVCFAKSPRCGECVVSRLCPSAFTSTADLPADRDA